MIRDRIKERISPDYLYGVRFNKSEKESLFKLASSTALKDRRLCINYLRTSYEVPQNLRFVIGLCDKMIPDRSHYVRGQSFIILGDFVRDYKNPRPCPDKIWPLIVKWGSVKNKDIRTGVACFLLEHLLQYHFDKFFPKVKEVIESGNRRFGYTLAYCYKLGQAEETENAKKFDAIASRFKLRRKTKS